MILNTQFSIQQFSQSTPLSKPSYNNYQDVNHNSGGTTRSGTPERNEEFNYTSPIKSQSPDNSLVEIGVKPKRKQFRTSEERQQFVESYKKKIKTELCKNFELRGWCKFGDNVIIHCVERSLMIYDSALLPMESTNSKRKRTFMRNIKQSLASSTIFSVAAPTATDANTFTVRH